MQPLLCLSLLKEASTSCCSVVALKMGVYEEEHLRLFRALGLRRRNCSDGMFEFRGHLLNLLGDIRNDCYHFNESSQRNSSIFLIVTFKKLPKQ